jgi:hypothetical protein
MRTLITPGRLYARISADFRKICCARCNQCVLPVPFTAEDGSWQIGDLSRECRSCAREIHAIVRRYQAKYDLLDPFSPLMLAREAQRMRPTHH